MRHALTVTVLALAAAPTLAHQGHAPGMDHRAMMAGNPYGQAEMDMNQKMMAAKQGDAAEMWTRKMIEHHRGAVAMSRVAVREARDPETRRMAQMTIAKQEADIAKLQGWLRTHGKNSE